MSNPARIPPGDSTEGLLLVDKPSGVTSHDVVGRVRRITGVRRVGHAGTLDPMATGLLVLAIGRATKLLTYLQHDEKSYRATIRLGAVTSTDDAEGDVLSETDATGVTAEELLEAIARHTGPIQQVPSAVSAIKVDGKRAYHLVRTGVEVQLAPRPVTVFDFTVDSDLRRRNGAVEVDVSVRCSAGTYIRALARDIGADLGVGGHLTALRRVAVGPFNVADAVDVYPGGVPPKGGPYPPLGADLLDRLRGSVLSAEQVARLLFPVRVVDAQQAQALRYGQRIAADGRDGIYAAMSGSNALVALMQDEDGTARSVLVWQSAP